MAGKALQRVSELQQNGYVAVSAQALTSELKRRRARLKQTRMIDVIDEFLGMPRFGPPRVLLMLLLTRECECYIANQRLTF